MKKIMLLIAISAILLLGAVEVSAQGFQYSGEKNTDYKPLPNGDGFMQRLRNRICDTLGICQGGVDLTTINGVLTFDGTNFYILVQLGLLNLLNQVLIMMEMEN